MPLIRSLKGLLEKIKSPQYVRSENPEYAMGIDPYRVTKDFTAGAICVIRREDGMVEYASRFTDAEEFKKQVVLIASYYGCSPVGESPQETKQQHEKKKENRRADS